jgi:hypothetical protein
VGSNTECVGKFSKNSLRENEGIFCLTNFLLLLFFSSSNFFLAQAKLDFKNAKINFGFVRKGEVVKIEYDFINAGNEPLIISNIEIECSCTSAEFPKQPILPGVSDKIIISFDTKTVYDRQDRTVNVLTNDKKSPHKLRYKGIVLNR